jgi:hypothetical protein
VKPPRHRCRTRKGPFVFDRGIRRCALTLEGLYLRHQGAAKRVTPRALPLKANWPRASEAPHAHIPGPFGLTISAESIGLQGFAEGVGCRLEARTDLTEFSGGEVDAFLLSIRTFLRTVGSGAHGLQLLGQLLHRPSQFRQLAGDDLGVLSGHFPALREFYDERSSPFGRRDPGARVTTGPAGSALTPLVCPFSPRTI